MGMLGFSGVERTFRKTSPHTFSHTVRVVPPSPLDRFLTCLFAWSIFWYRARSVATWALCFAFNLPCPSDAVFAGRATFLPGLDGCRSARYAAFPKYAVGHLAGSCALFTINPFFYNAFTFAPGAFLRLAWWKRRRLRLGGRCNPVARPLPGAGLRCCRLRRCRWFGVAVNGHGSGTDAMATICLRHGGMRQDDCGQ